MSNLIFEAKRRIENNSLNFNKLIFETHLVSIQNNMQGAIKAMVDEYFPLFFMYCSDSLKRINIGENWVIEHASQIYERTINYVNHFLTKENKSFRNFIDCGRLNIRTYILRLYEKEKIDTNNELPLNEANNVKINQIDKFLETETYRILTKYLTEEELEVFSLYCGLFDEPRMSVERMAKELKCTHQNIYIILKKAKEKVRDMMSSLDYMHTI